MYFQKYSSATYIHSFILFDVCNLIVQKGMLTFVHFRSLEIFLISPFTASTRPTFANAESIMLVLLFLDTDFNFERNCLEVNVIFFPRNIFESLYFLAERLMIGVCSLEKESLTEA